MRSITFYSCGTVKAGLKPHQKEIGSKMYEPLRFNCAHTLLSLIAQFPCFCNEAVIFMAV